MRNKYEVPEKTWELWSKRARHVFNKIYKTFGDQGSIIHPETHPLHEAEWNTIRWNVAWLAAWVADGYKIKIKNGF